MHAMNKLIATVTLLFAAHSAFAADIFVTRTDDPVPTGLGGSCTASSCSLRQAVILANKTPGRDRIVLKKAEYVLSRTQRTNPLTASTGPLLITAAVDIVGAGPGLTRIRWTTGSHISHQNELVHGILVDVRLQNLTLTGGRGQHGGCVVARGAWQLEQVNIENCRAGYGGGAMHYAGGVLELRDVLMQGNEAAVDGGALRIVGDATTVIADGAQFIENTALASGGAVASGLAPEFPAGNIVWRNEGRGSEFVGNSAGRHGGAIAVGAGHTFNLYSLDPDSFGARFLENVAVENGGAIDVRSQAGRPARLILERSHLYRNRAANGGALSSNGEILVTTSEFASNLAVDDGGAMSLSYLAPGALGWAEIRQTSFRGNGARAVGGIDNQCQALNVRDTSFASNFSVGSTLVGAIRSSGQTALTHVTAGWHHYVGALSIPAFHRSYHTACGSQPFTVANSLLRDTGCSSSGITSLGGNQLGPSSVNCGATALDQVQTSNDIFALSLGSFGGLLEVAGWPNDGATRPQVGFGLSAYCSSVDVHGLPRSDGACDAGAFEQQ